MKNFLIAILFIASIKNGISQQYFGATSDSAVEIGIIEHLGDTIPLNLNFQNEKDSTIILGDLINKPTVLSFVYFDCPGLCSPLLEGVSEVIEKSDMVLGTDYDVITISFNYRDSPEGARQKKENFLKKHSRDNAEHWKYLTGDSDNIYKIVNAVGFKFKKAGLDYIHAAGIIIISPKGKITRYLYGLNFLPLDFKMAIIESQKGLARPSINRVMDFCYAYDPAGRRYTLDVLKVSATIIIFLIIIFIVILSIYHKRKKN
jgi:protein SCO1/2